MTDVTAIPNGLVECTNDEYHSGPGISKTHLDVIAGKSLLHYWHRYLNPEREPDIPTPAKVLGSAIHSIILEPDLFETNFVPNPGIDRRSNAGKAEYAAFIAEHVGKTILDDSQYQSCLHVRDAVYRHPVAAGLFRAPGKAEQSFYATEPRTGELIKCRFDKLHDGGGMAIDLKSTDDASPEGFGKSASNYRYDLQVPWYFDVMEILYGETPRHWAFVAVEKDPPYAIGIYYATQASIDIARNTMLRDFGRIVQTKQIAAELLAAGSDPMLAWPDYGNEILPLELPKWTKR